MLGTPKVKEIKLITTKRAVFDLLMAFPQGFVHIAKEYLAGRDHMVAVDQMVLMVLAKTHAVVTLAEHDLLTSKSSKQEFRDAVAFALRQRYGMIQSMLTHYVNEQRAKQQEVQEK